MLRLVVCVLAVSSAALSLASCASTGSPALAHKEARANDGACESALTIFSAVREACAFQQRRDAGYVRQRSGASHSEMSRTNVVSVQNSATVYGADECVGAVVNGQCHGTIIEARAYHPTCHGQMLNGQCTGPMF